jgi:hypothetical protein
MKRDLSHRIKQTPLPLDVGTLLFRGKLLQIRLRRQFDIRADSIRKGPRPFEKFL